MLQTQHLLVLTPSWGCGSRLLLSGAHFLGIAEGPRSSRQPEMAAHTPQQGDCAPLSSAVQHWGCLLPVGEKTWAVFLVAVPPFPNLGSSGREQGRITEGAGGYPGDRWLGPLAGSSPVVQASVSWWCHLLAPGRRLYPSAGQGGTAWVLHVPYIRNKQTNQGDQHINPHFGEKEKNPLLRYIQYPGNLWFC